MNVKRVIILITVLIGMVCIGCNNAATLDQASATEQKTEQKTKIKLESLPLKIVLIDDVSGSIKDNGINRVTAETFNLLIEKLKTTGGVLAFGMIDENAYDMHLVILRLEKAPKAPEKLIRKKGELAFKFKKRKMHYEEDENKYDKEKAEYLKIAKAKEEAFKKEAEKVFLTENSRWSDVWGAINVANRFLSEPELVNHQCYMILNSDCQHNTKTKLEPIKTGAKIIIVNTSGVNTKMKALQNLPDVENFSSLDAAIQKIINTKQ